MKIMTKGLFLTAFMIAAVSMYGQKQGGGDNELRDKIQKLNKEMVGATITGNDAKVLMFYADEAISMPNYGKILKGKDAIAKSQQESSESGSKVLALTLNTKKVTAYGDAVVEIGTYSITFEVANAPEPIKDEGKYLTVWVKYGDTYKIVNEIWNTNTYPLKGDKKDEGNKKPKPTDAEKKNGPKEDADIDKSGKKINDKKSGGG